MGIIALITLLYILRNAMIENVRSYSVRAVHWYKF